MNCLQESVYRRIKERQVRQQEIELQRQIRTYIQKQILFMSWHIWLTIINLWWIYPYLTFLFRFTTEAQQYHVYTLQPLSNPLQNSSTTTISSVLSQQQQEYIHEQQELKGMFIRNE